MAPIYSDVTFPFQTSRSRFVSFWREGIRQAGKDWRARWRRAGLWFLAIIWFVGLLLTLSFTAGLSGSQNYSYASACQPDGSFSVDPSTYQYWSKSGFFQITLGFGNLTFTQAKAIDIIWDVVSAWAYTLGSMSMETNSFQVLRSGRSSTSCTHLMASLCELCHDLHGGGACHFWNLPDYIFTEPISPPCHTPHGQRLHDAPWPTLEDRDGIHDHHNGLHLVISHLW